MMKPEGTEAEYLLESLYEHPLYNNVTSVNDLALLKVDKPIRFTREVMPACLAESVDELDKYSCHVTGWGLTNGE